MKMYSPLSSPEHWNLDLEVFTIPTSSSFRYAGHQTIAIKATWTAAGQAEVCAPTWVVVRDDPTGASNTLELEILPFQIRKAAQSLPFGLPVLYIKFEDGNIDPLKNAQPGSKVGAASHITLAAVFPDGILRDPLYWAAEFQKALTAAGEDISDWQKFLNRLSVQNSAKAPVLLLDHRGAPLETGQFEVIVGNTAHTVALQKGDLGNIRKVFESATNLSIWNASIQPAPPLAPGAADFQLACMEAKSGAAGKITVSQDKRHILLTNLPRWFAPQYAKIGNPPASPLNDYTRHNALIPLVNGNEFFKDIFQTLDGARGAGGGFHLVGWDMAPETLFVDPLPDAPADFRTLKKVAELVGSPNQLSCCFLPAKFITPKPGSQLGNVEALFILGLVSLLYFFKTLNLPIWRTDGSGAAVLALLLIVNSVLMKELMDKDLADLEPNKEAKDTLHNGTRSVCILSPYPATIYDNPLVDPQERSLLSKTVFKAIERFDVYHQKFAIVHTTNGQYVGYCGGVDFNPNRLDDANHLSPQPFHDVHARITGPAVRDLAITFDQRWKYEGQNQGAFNPPSEVDLGKPGNTIIQVARTYFKTGDATRKLPFAPQGDRTILNTILQAIEAARKFIYIEDQYFTPPKQTAMENGEYQNALLKKVKQGEIERLIIALPGVTDQPFGETFRNQFLKDLLAASSEIVQIGSPRRRYTVPRCDLRASSGKMLLMQNWAIDDDEIVLGPVERVPAVPPFWVSVEGELIYVYEESATVYSSARAFKVERSENTHLISSEPSSKKGSWARTHKKGAPVTLVELSGIYVHAKLMIVDDIFMSVGSANINRRGFYSDGETNIFAVPESLKADPANPVLALRKRLWAEMMDLPYPAVAPLLDDPVAASELFKRSWFLGNRFVPHDALPHHLMPFPFTGGDTIVSLLGGALQFEVATKYNEIYKGVIDPASQLELEVGP